MAELVAPVALCSATGQLNPAAVGWSRQPLHTANLRGRARSRSWERWGLVTPRYFIELVISTLGILGDHGIHVLDRRTGAWTDLAVHEAGARSVTLPDRAATGIARAAAGSLALEFAVTAAGTRLRASGPGVRVAADVASPVAHESLAVVVPWSPTRFQYTVKDVGRPASGTLVLGDAEHAFGSDGSFAVRDHVRARRPQGGTSHWGVGAGRVAGRKLALQLGGPWPGGAGATQNAVFVDGRLNRIDEDLRWEHDRADRLAPWRISGPRVRVTFAPAHQRSRTTGPGPLGSEVHQCFGVFTGWVVDDGGRRLRVDGVVGWVEEARRRW